MWYYAQVVESPFNHLHPDDNVQQAIEQTLRELNVAIKSKHVKGHQDDTRSVSLKELMHKRTNLKWEAQLNIIADKLGHIAQRQLTSEVKSQFSLLLAGKAYLLINN
eukprot:2034291-Ditylum_brightwellii.AAC.2